MSKTVIIGGIQISDCFGGSYYLPYTIGIILSYGLNNICRNLKIELLPIIYKRIPIYDAINILAQAEIVFISLYLWNYNYSLELAKNLKKFNNKIIIFCGGPQISKNPVKLESFLRTHNYIDFACYGEGEKPTLGFLEAYQKQDWNSVPSIAFLNADGIFHITPETDGIGNLDEIPSPYLNGFISKIMEDNPEELWSCLWETNRGCPHSCSFCAWSSSRHKKLKKFSLERLEKEIRWFGENNIEFLFCCDSNFGIYPDRDSKIVDLVISAKKEYGYPKSFSVQSTKNATDIIFNFQKKLNEAGLQKGVNLALQSVNPSTLEAIKRKNISPVHYRRLQKMFMSEGIQTFTDFLLGLPNDTYESFTHGIGEIIEDGQYNRVQFINLVVLENSEMAESDYQKKYGLILQKSKIIAHHTKIFDLNEESVAEYQDLVIGTNTLSREEWVRCRIFCWMTSLIFFNKLLQIPIILLNKISKIPYPTIINRFIDSHDNTPLFNKIYSIFKNHALSIQQGGIEYIPSDEWLGIFWPADEYVLIKISKDGLLRQFYSEAEIIIRDLLQTNNVILDIQLFSESIKLNAALQIQPNLLSDIIIETNYGIYNFYQDVLIGYDPYLEQTHHQYLIKRSLKKYSDWDTWCREVVWYGSKRGAYLYYCEELVP